ncbi:MAG TPA: hypothetical protein VLT89_10055 [Usitatibacter sp.]|nr:hypothetical protein [Usitatibacter sp.]
MSALRILWISAGRAVLEDTNEGTRLDFLLDDLAKDEKTIGKLSPIDAFRLGYQAALHQQKGA